MLHKLAYSLIVGLFFTVTVYDKDCNILFQATGSEVVILKEGTIGVLTKDNKYKTYELEDTEANITTEIGRWREDLIWRDGTFSKQSRRVGCFIS